MRILAKELADCYAGRSSGRPNPAPSYLVYCTTHRNWVDGGAVDSQVSYWKVRLAGHSGVLQLPTDFPRPHQASSAGALESRILPEDLCSRITNLAKSRCTTPFTVHLAAFLLLLRQHGADADAVVAIPVANRNHAAAANLVGTLVNTLPFRMTLMLDDTFTSLLERVREASFEMQANQDAPFEKIIEAVKPELSEEHAPLAQVMFDHQEIPLAENWPGGITCHPFISPPGCCTV